MSIRSIDRETHYGKELEGDKPNTTTMDKNNSVEEFYLIVLIVNTERKTRQTDNVWNNASLFGHWDRSTTDLSQEEMVMGPYRRIDEEEEKRRTNRQQELSNLGVSRRRNYNDSMVFR